MLVTWNSSIGNSITVYIAVQFPSLIGVYWIAISALLGIALFAHYRLRMRHPEADEDELWRLGMVMRDAGLVPSVAALIAR